VLGVQFAILSSTIYAVKLTDIFGTFRPCSWAKDTMVLKSTLRPLLGKIMKTARQLLCIELFPSMAGYNVEIIWI
jgi:hypothetical protein